MLKNALLYSNYLALLFINRFVNLTNFYNMVEFVAVYFYNVEKTQRYFNNSLVENLRKNYVYNHINETTVFGACTLLVSQVCGKNTITTLRYYRLHTRVQFFTFLRTAANNYILYYDILALYGALHQLYYLLYNCSLEQASLYLLADSYFLQENLALNYYFLVGLQNDFMHFIHDYTKFSFDLCEFIQHTETMPVDFIFIMDVQIRRKYFEALTSYNTCLIGVCYNALELGIFDIALPVDTTDLVTQYYFFEFILSVTNSANCSIAAKKRESTVQLFNLF